MSGSFSLASGGKRDDSTYNLSQSRDFVTQGRVLRPARGSMTSLLWCSGHIDLGLRRLNRQLPHRRKAASPMRNWRWSEKRKLQKRGFMGSSNAKSSLAVLGGGLPAMIAINNACLKFDVQIVEVLCSSLQSLVHRTNQFPERLRTCLILIRQLATHLAH